MNVNSHQSGASGQKRPWVLLRGLLREQRHWGDFPRQVKAQLQASEIIALDVAGNGQKSTHISPNSISGMVEDLRLDLKQQGIREPVNIIALSMGGMITIHWLCRYPPEINQAVLINTSMKPFSPFYQRLRPATYRSLIMAMLKGHEPALEALILKLTSNQVRSSNEQTALLEQWLNYRQKNPVSGCNAGRQLYAAMRFAGPVELITHPLLLLASQKDQLVDSRCSQAMAEHWHCPVVLHPEAGHDLPLDDPDWVIQQILSWQS